MPLSGIARGAASAERGRRLMQLRGITPNGHPLWQGWAVQPVVDGYPDYQSIFPALERRTKPAVYGKASRLGITAARRLWDDREILRLRLYRTGSRTEVLAALPGRTWGAISAAARKRGFRRPQRPLVATGITVIDQILSRSRDLGWTLADLDSAAHSRMYFTRKKWRGRYLDHAVHRRVVEALGGQIRARLVQKAVP